MKALLITLSLTIWMQGCCGAKRTEPSYPKEITGWNDHKVGTTKLRGTFLLKKGESTDNGRLRISVLDLIPPACTGDAGDFAARARVTLEFTRVSDQSVLCSEAYPENGGRSFFGGCTGIPDEFKIFGVGVRAINLKEGWVFFALDGDY